LRAAIRWLRDGGALIAFPSGEVAHRSSPHDGRADSLNVDSPWHTTVARLGLRTGAQILPAFIAGRDSRLFYAAGRVHSSLRTLLLARELLGKRGQGISVQLGEPTRLSGSACAGDAAAATSAIRSAVAACGSGGHDGP